GGGKEGVHLFGGVGLNLIGAGGRTGDALHRRGVQDALADEPAEQRAEMPVYGVDRAWAERTKVLMGGGGAPSSAWLFVPVIEVVEVGAQLVQAADLMPLRAEEPEELANDVAAALDGALGVLVYVSGQEPAFGMARKADDGDTGGVGICETRCCFL